LHFNRSKLVFRVFLVIIFLSAMPLRVRAQSSGPTYVIQPGDTLYSIAMKFDVSKEDIIQANQLKNPDVLSAGMELIIPGLEGVQGKLITKTVPLGQNLTSLSRFYQLPVTQLNKLNRLTSPAEVYAGASLILPQSDTAAYKFIGVLSNQQTLLEFSALHNSNPWQITDSNETDTPTLLIPGEQVFTSTTADNSALGNPLEPVLTKLELNPLPLVQGSTAVIRLIASEQITPTGSLNGKELHFFKNGDNDFVAIQGIHAMAEPGLANFNIQLNLADGSTRTLDQMVLLQDGYYPQDAPLTVDPETIDPANTKPEDDFVAHTIAPATPNKLWDGIFHNPVDEPICVKSGYGNRRSYNGGPYSYFHTGLDYGVCANLNIYAAAAGTVVFAGPLTVRGNATFIDHGWGVYTAYYHQKEILVKVGDHVDAGQMIGQIGATGRVTGPHLHFEVWANNIQVNPWEWLERAVP
jgi:murein DD-endopeptidase MepM/ murein hydrolase activator NlpD